MALSTVNLEYDITTTAIFVARRQGGQPWTIGNTGGSNVFIGAWNASADATLTGTETQLKALATSRGMLAPFGRMIIPADVESVGLVTGTGYTSTVIVQSGIQDEPEPNYVSLAVNLAKNGTRVILANAVASTQVWVYAVRGTSDAQGHITLIDSTPGTGAHANANSGTGVMPVGALGGIDFEAHGKTAPIFKGASAKGLSMILPAGNDFDGTVTYALVVV